MYQNRIPLQTVYNEWVQADRPNGLKGLRYFYKYGGAIQKNYCDHCGVECYDAVDGGPVDICTSECRKEYNRKIAELEKVMDVAEHEWQYGKIIFAK